MKDNQMHNLDFNSIKVLKVLGEELNTQKAADRLFLSQSAVSKALKRLRAQFDDELFIRTHRGMVPTEKCARLLSKLPSVMRNLQELYSHKDEFVPETYRGQIKIHLNGTFARPLIKTLFMRLHQLAPKATITLESWSTTTERQLLAGDVHVGINYTPIDVSHNIAQIETNAPEVRLCCHKDSPLAKKDKVLLEDVAQYPLVVVRMPDYVRKDNRIISYYQERGFEPRILLRSDKLDICLDTVRKIHSVMAVCEITRQGLFEELTLLNINHWEGVVHNKIGCFVNQKFKDTPFSQWLIDVIQEEIEALY
ncbi:LysR family transcriptional regulator [Vibrio astriarenae]|jgi:DNA-binding transcriptional LysR family regulator